MVIFPILACLVWKQLQIGTDMLLVITSPGDVHFSGINIDDLEWSWTTKIGIFSDLVTILGCKTVNCDKMDKDRPRLSANRNCCRLSCISWALAQISCTLHYNSDNIWIVKKFFRGCAVCMTQKGSDYALVTIWVFCGFWIISGFFTITRLSLCCVCQEAALLLVEI